MTGEHNAEEISSDKVLPTSRVSGAGKIHVNGLGDITIAGSGHVSPGRIKIAGSGRLPGGIKVDEVSSAGSIDVGGDLTAQNAAFSGSTTIDGNANIHTLTVSGSLNVRGRLDGFQTRSSGSLRIGNAAKLDDTLRVVGFLGVRGDVSAGNRVDFRGGFEIAGKVSTKSFEAELGRSESNVQNGISAVNVSVTKARGLLVFGLLNQLFRRGRLYTTAIEATGSVQLVNVCCDDVFGKDVIIGEGCHIKGRIRYSNSLSVHPNAKLTAPPEKMT